MPRLRQQPAVTAPIEDVDLPPDRHPARRPVLVMLLLAMMVLIVRAGWGWIAERRLNAVRADLERRGFLSNAQTPNATAAEQEALSWLDEANHSSLLDAGLYVMQARKAGPVRWPAPRGDAPWQGYGPMITPRLYPLCRWLQIDATLAHGSGDDRLAIEYLRDIIYVSHACERIDSPAGAPYSAQVSFWAIVAIDDIAPHLRGDATASYSRSEVQGLISDLLDDEGGWARLASRSTFAKK